MLLDRFQATNEEHLETNTNNTTVTVIKIEKSMFPNGCILLREADPIKT